MQDDLYGEIKTGDATGVESVAVSNQYDGGQRKAVPHGVYRGGGADPGQGIRGIQEDSDVSPVGRRETNQSDYF